jgi:hypothetical protein
MHKIWTKAVSQWNEDQQKYVLVDAESSFYMYDGPLCELKGDDTAKQTEELQQQNASTQLAQNQQLMNMMSTQYGKQSQIYSYLQSKMQPMIDNPTGYSAQALTSMRTSADDTLSNNYSNAQKALNQTQFANGSRDLPSGVSSQLNASLMGAEASDKAGAQNQITQADANLKQQNYWNAVNTLNGVGTETNPLGYASAATGAANAASSAGNSVAGLSQAYTQSQQSGLAGVLGGLAGGVFGAAGQAGGFGKLFSCHVAAAVFGEPDDLSGAKTTLVRSWMAQMAAKHWYARSLVSLYNRTSKALSKSKVAVWALTPLFKLFLKKAEESK